MIGRYVKIKPDGHPRPITVIVVAVEPMTKMRRDALVQWLDRAATMDSRTRLMFSSESSDARDYVRAFDSGYRSIVKDAQGSTYRTRVPYEEWNEHLCALDMTTSADATPDLSRHVIAEPAPPTE